MLRIAVIASFLLACQTLEAPPGSSASQTVKGSGDPQDTSVDGSNTEETNAAGATGSSGPTGPSGPAGSSGPTGVSGSIAQFRADYAAAYCDNLGPCCAADGYPYDAAACRQLQEKLLVATYPDQGYALDATAAAACIAAVHDVAASCVIPTTSPTLAECHGVLTALGTAQPGDACTTLTDCDPSAGIMVWCNGGTCAAVAESPLGDQCATPGPIFYACDAATGYCANGICVAKKATGQPCISGQCATASFCPSKTLKCKALIAVGDACDPVDLDGCIDSAYCDGMSNKCTTKPSVGQACSRIVPCAENLVCHGWNYTCGENDPATPTLCLGQ
jgi:hypothetical protein